MLVTVLVSDVTVSESDSEVRSIQRKMEAQRSSPDMSGFQTHAFLSFLCKSGDVQRSQDTITGSVLLLAWLGVLLASKPMFPYAFGLQQVLGNAD